MSRAETIKTTVIVSVVTLGICAGLVGLLALVIGQPLTEDDAESLNYRTIDGVALNLIVYKPRDWKETDTRPCIVWFFGPDRGGSVAANLRRWKSQFQLEGKPRLQVVKVAPGIRAHCIDASGTYVAETRPGSGTRVNKPGWRLLGAVLEVPGGPLFIKLAGPEKTVGAAAAVWMEWIRSFRKAVR